MMINNSYNLKINSVRLWPHFKITKPDLSTLLYHPVLALKRVLPPNERFDLDLDLDIKKKDKTSEFEGIRCPLCAWQPNASSRWYCASNRHPEGLAQGCGTVWNSFTSRGQCPGCQHQWRWTTCLQCHRWSLHEDWYVDNKR